MSSTSLKGQPFKIQFERVLQALVADSVVVCNREVYCPWSTTNTVPLGLGQETRASYFDGLRPGVSVLSGLIKLGIIAKVRCDYTPHWQQYRETYWKRVSGVTRSKSVYEILHKARLKRLLAKPPAEELKGWEAFCLTGKRSLPPAEPMKFQEIPATPREATQQLLKVIGLQPDPVRELSHVLVTLTIRLHRMTRRHEQSST